MRRHFVAIACCCAVSLVSGSGCDCDPTSDAPAVGSAALPTPSASAAAVASGRVGALLEAELTRRAGDVSDDDLASRDVRVRRAAARALARARDDSSREHLLRLLADEDEEVVAWAAYGLGEEPLCKGHRDATVSALVATATARAAGTADAGVAGPRLSAQRAIARAIGRCAGSRSEATLVAWARRRGPHAVEAIYALGDIARARKRLAEATAIALLKLAEGDASRPPMVEALYPLGRVEHMTPSVIERAREVAKARLADKGAARVFAVQVLGRCDDPVVSLLKEVLAKPTEYTAAERAEAVRGLTRFGRDGQEALIDALQKLVPDTSPVASTALISPDVGVLLLALESLTIMRGAGQVLTNMAKLPAPPQAPKPIERRLSWLRCSAAKLVAERNFTMPLLRACDLSVKAADQAKDPLTGSIGARAVVDAIGVDGAKIIGTRLIAFKAYALGGDLRARQAALQLLAEHDEVREAAEVLAKAIEADEPGLVATAAEVISKHPARAYLRKPLKKGAAPAADPAIMKALVDRLDGSGPTADIEALVAVIDAAGALKVTQAKAKLVGLCASPYAKIRESSRKALGALMGKAAPRCDSGEGMPLPVELERRVDAPTTLTLQTDVGELTLRLQPSLAPIAVTRAVDLARNGFYKGMVVHRVVPGFVSQFGSPTSDGYGGVKGLPSLPCETSPSGYGTLTVGVALAGRDTGSSQLFVTHGATPHLDGQYALLGTATGPWDALIDGDVIHDVQVAK